MNNLSISRNRSAIYEDLFPVCAVSRVRHDNMNQSHHSLLPMLIWLLLPLLQFRQFYIHPYFFLHSSHFFQSFTARVSKHVRSALAGKGKINYIHRDNLMIRSNCLCFFLVVPQTSPLTGSARLFVFDRMNEWMNASAMQQRSCDTNVDAKVVQLWVTDNKFW